MVRSTNPLFRRLAGMTSPMRGRFGPVFESMEAKPVRRRRVSALTRAALFAGAALALYGAACGDAVAAARADRYPDKPVRMIVSFPPGSGPDILARTLGQRLDRIWGQQLIVENRPGAGGNIAMGMTASAPPDGYTLIVLSNQLAINPSLFRKVPYDPVKSFAPVTLATWTPNVLVVHPSLPVKTVKDLISLAKAKPGALNFSSGGNGSVGHLAGELFKSMAHVGIVHVPYKGPVEALTALFNGEVSLAFLIAPQALPNVKAGRLRALAVTSTKRFKAAPELHTLDESGLRGYDVVAWQGILAPARTPPGVVRTLHDDIVRVLGEPEIQANLGKLGLDVIADTPQGFSGFIKTEVAKWARVVKASGANVD